VSIQQRAVGFDVEYSFGKCLSTTPPSPVWFVVLVVIRRCPSLYITLSSIPPRRAQCPQPQPQPQPCPRPATPSSLRFSPSSSSSQSLSRSSKQRYVCFYTPLLVVSNDALNFSLSNSSMLSRPSPSRHLARRRPGRPQSLSHTEGALRPYQSPVPSPTPRSSPRRPRHPPLVSPPPDRSPVGRPPSPSSRIEKRCCTPRGSS
jgi:hypothetical protein